MTTKFESSQIVITPAARDAFDESFIQSCLQRHLTGDWGDLCDEDKASNDAALVEGQEGRLFSSYKHPQTGDKVWIITEWDRSATTVLLPSDY